MVAGGGLLLSDNLGGLAGDAGVSVFLPENGTLFSVIPTCGTELPQEGYQLQFYLLVFYFSFLKHKITSGNLPSVRYSL